MGNYGEYVVCLISKIFLHLIGSCLSLFISLSHSFSLFQFNGVFVLNRVHVKWIEFKALNRVTVPTNSPLSLSFWLQFTDLSGLFSFILKAIKRCFNPVKQIKMCFPKQNPRKKKKKNLWTQISKNRERLSDITKKIEKLRKQTFSWRT